LAWRKANEVGRKHGRALKPEVFLEKGRAGFG